MQRQEIADYISRRLQAEKTKLTEQYAASGRIGYFLLDNLLPESLAKKAAECFPPATQLHGKQTLRERKFVSSQMNRHDSILEETLFAFQAPDVVNAIKDIVHHQTLYPDPMLYAGGISRMEQGGFLNPHIDNSHDKERKKWRSLNLLYYISPGWQREFGGNLEVWTEGTRRAPITIDSLFNRLVVMTTHQHAWHSVSPIVANQSRLCISNYYFSDQPMHPNQSFHVTSFRGRPEQPVIDIVLRGDALMRGCLRKIKSGGFFPTGHWYNTEGA